MLPELNPHQDYLITEFAEDYLESQMSRRDMLRLPQPSCAPMACPSLPVWVIHTHPIQTAARISLEILHDPLWLTLRFHNRVHVITSHVGGQQTPAALAAHCLNGFQYSVATDLVHVIGRLIHALHLRSNTRGILV